MRLAADDIGLTAMRIGTLIWTHQRGKSMHAGAAGNKASVPAHVPADRVVDFDYFREAGFRDDPHATLLTLQQYPDIVYTTANGGHWIATRAAVIFEVLHEPALFSNYPAALPASTASPVRVLPIEVDPPEQTFYRRVIAPIFAPRAIDELEVQIRNETIQLVQGFLPRGGCEFVSEFAQQMPVAVFLGMMDLPSEHRPLFLRWVEQVARTADHAEKMSGVTATQTYLRAIIEARAAASQNDIISRLIRAEVNGRRLTLDEVLGLAYVIFFGGLDTVTGTLSFMVRYLAMHPQEQERLRNSPELIRNAVEELMRRHGLVNLPRTLTRDVQFHGLTLRKGEQILLPTALYGLDDQKTQNPLTVDFDRKVIHHTHFGAGPHRCPGSHLARLELRIFLEEWLERVPRFTMAPDTQARALGGPIMGMSSLPLSWGRPALS